MSGDLAPEYVAEHVRQALTTDARTMEQGLDVRVVGDEVYVSGTVTSAERRDAVRQVAAEAAAGRRVHNEVDVAEPADRHTTERIT
ncbi:MAG TPA: BON domain-containing protein [Acidimicrobiales bacterium]|nr:BON domain-containing protein [Acidimicrobiales bacterium]